MGLFLWMHQKQRVKQMLNISSSSPSANREQQQLWYSANEVLKLLDSSKWQREDICIDPWYTTGGNPFLTSVEHKIQKFQTRSLCSAERANITLLEPGKYWKEKRNSEGKNQAVPRKYNAQIHTGILPRLWEQDQLTTELSPQIQNMIFLTPGLGWTLDY